MSAHTPGPWRVVKPMHGLQSKYRCVQLGKDPSYTTLELLPADARLISQAPRLLEELISLVARCDGEEGIRADGSNIQTMSAHAAIAKAEGRE